MSSEYVYRRKGELVWPKCEVCGEPAFIELHVGVGGNYRVAYVCASHDRQPDHYLLSGEPVSA